MSTRLIVLVITLAARAAFAGGPCPTDTAIQELEAYAKTGKHPPAMMEMEMCMHQVRSDPPLVKRALAACTTVVAREPKHHTCLRWSVMFGAKKLGPVDLFDRVADAFALEPFRYQAPAIELYNELADPRALPLVLAAWRAALSDKRSGPRPSANDAHNWIVWRHAAVKLFGKVGGATERAFLVEQAGVTTDGYLAKAIAAAIAEIDKRRP